MKKREIPKELFVEDRRPKNPEHDDERVWAWALLAVLILIFLLWK